MTTWYASLVQTPDGSQRLTAWCASRVWVDHPAALLPAGFRRVAIVRARSKIRGRVPC